MKNLFTHEVKYEGVEVDKLKEVTAKNIYLENSSSFPPPKVIYKYDLNWDLVFKRLNHPILESSAKNIMFMIIHNIIPNRDRLNRMNRATDNLCPVDNKTEDNVHLFCECTAIEELWTWIRSVIISELNCPSSQIENFDMLHFNFPFCVFGKEIIWLISNYCDLLWTEKIRKGKKLNLIKTKLELKHRWLQNNQENRPHLNYIDFS